VDVHVNPPPVPRLGRDKAVLHWQEKPLRVGA
jgi:hypothetical protein